jgi:uncharacterized protein (TIGR00255 family)
MSLKSMTGYGKGEAECDGLTVTVELKSVNHRYADISVRLPRSFLALENVLRKRVAKSLKRGKVDVYVNYELSAGSQATPQLNFELAAAYKTLLVGMQKDMGLTGGVSAEYLAGQKDVIQLKDAELDEQLLQECLFAALEKGLTQLLEMRGAEGEETRRDIAFADGGEVTGRDCNKSTASSPGMAREADRTPDTVAAGN